jgi:four helix bundle protein
LQKQHALSGNPEILNDALATRLLLRLVLRDGLDQLEERTKQFTIEAIRLCITLEALAGLRNVAWQLTKCSGSVGANHRAMRRARSRREFSAKLQIVNEEIDEAVFWLEVVRALYPNAVDELPRLHREGMELRSIFAKARSTLRSRN